MLLGDIKEEASSTTVMQELTTNIESIMLSHNQYLRCARCWI